MIIAFQQCFGHSRMIICAHCHLLISACLVLLLRKPEPDRGRSSSCKTGDKIVAQTKFANNRALQISYFRSRLHLAFENRRKAALQRVYITYHSFRILVLLGCIVMSSAGPHSDHEMLRTTTISLKLSSKAWQVVYS